MSHMCSAHSMPASTTHTPSHRIVDRHLYCNGAPNLCDALWCPVHYLKPHQRPTHRVQVQGPTREPMDFPNGAHKLHDQRPLLIVWPQV